MARRVLRAARSRGVEPPGISLLERAHGLAMEPRLRSLADDHDPDLLHPGRSALVLLLDVGESRPAVLAPALLAESERPELRVSPGLVGAALGSEVAERVAAVPPAGTEDLAERLVTADAEVVLVALAERLDHLRHAHLWPDRARRRRAHAEAVDVYAPVAERVHPVLARRYRWWCGMFASRYLE